MSRVRADVHASKPSPTTWNRLGRDETECLFPLPVEPWDPTGTSDSNLGKGNQSHLNEFKGRMKECRREARRYNATSTHSTRSLSLQS